VSPHHRRDVQETSGKKFYNSLRRSGARKPSGDAVVDANGFNDFRVLPRTDAKAR
jgi:hypothetical protein